MSTLMERFVIDWLLIYIGDQLDRDQFGGQKGHSVAHYLINFVSYNQDLSKPFATLLAGVDISKGFNNIGNNILRNETAAVATPNSSVLPVRVDTYSAALLTHVGHRADAGGHSDRDTTGPLLLLGTLQPGRTS